LQIQEINKLSSAVSQYQQWFILASREIEQLRADLQELEKGLNCSDATLLLRTEVTNLKNKVLCRLHQYEMWSPTCDFTTDFSVIYVNIILQYCKFTTCSTGQECCALAGLGIFPPIFTCKKLMIIARVLRAVRCAHVCWFYWPLENQHCKLQDRRGGGVVWPYIRRENCFQKPWV